MQPTATNQESRPRRGISKSSKWIVHPSTEGIPKKCECGAAIDPETRELAAMFPSIVPAAQCDDCLNASARAEKTRKDALARSMEQSRREARLENIPPEMLRTRINFQGFNAGLWVRVEQWEPSGLQWLGLLGPAGSSKTRCLALLAKRLILDGHHVTWTTAVAFQDRVDDLRGDRETVKEAHAYFSRCRSAGVLIVDDFGKNTWTPALERHLFSLIDHRKTHDLPVLWTANSSPLEILASGQLSKDRGAPLIGRMLEASRIEKA